MIEDLLDEFAFIVVVFVVDVVTRMREFAAVETAVRSAEALSPWLFTFASSIVDSKCVKRVGYACAFVAVFALT